MLFTLLGGAGLAIARPKWAAANALDAPSLLINGAFEEWEGNRPVGWQWRESPPALTRLSEDRNGKPVVSVRESNALYQDATELAVRAGDRLVFEGFVRSGEEGMVTGDITLHYPERHDPREVVRASIPRGNWHYMRLVHRVPEDQPAAIRFAIHMQREMRSPLLVSNLRAYIVPRLL